MPRGHVFITGAVPPRSIHMFLPTFAVCSAAVLASVSGMDISKSPEDSSMMISVDNVLPPEMLESLDFSLGITNYLNDLRNVRKMTNPAVLFDFLVESNGSAHEYKFLFNFMAGKYPAVLTEEEVRQVHRFIDMMIKSGKIPEDIAEHMMGPIWRACGPHTVTESHGLILRSPDNILRLLFSHLFQTGSFATDTWYDHGMYDAVLKCFLGNVYHRYAPIALNHRQNPREIKKTFLAPSDAEYGDRFRQWFVDFFCTRKNGWNDPEAIIQLLTEESAVRIIGSLVDFEMGLVEIIKFCLEFKPPVLENLWIQGKLLEAADILLQRFHLERHQVIKVMIGDYSELMGLQDSDVAARNLLLFVPDKNVLKEHIAHIPQFMYARLSFDEKLEFMWKTKSFDYEPALPVKSRMFVKVLEMIAKCPTDDPRINQERAEFVKGCVVRDLDNMLYWNRDLVGLLIDLVEDWSSEEWNRVNEFRVAYSQNLTYENLSKMNALNLAGSYILKIYASKSLHHSKHVPQLIINYVSRYLAGDGDGALVSLAPVSEILAMFISEKADPDHAISVFFDDFKRHGAEINAEAAKQIVDGLKTCPVVISKRLQLLCNTHELSLVSEGDMKPLRINNGVTARVPRRARVVDLYKIFSVLAKAGLMVFEDSHLIADAHFQPLPLTSRIEAVDAVRWVPYPRNKTELLSSIEALEKEH